MAELFVSLVKIMKKVFAFVDERCPKSAVSALIREGFYPIPVPPFPHLSDPVSSHTDMLLFLADRTLISYADYAEENEEFFKLVRTLTKDRGINLRFISDAVSKEYPLDARLNALSVGGRLFLKTDTAAGALTEWAKSRGIRTVHTNQGYPACTVLKLSDGAAVTADRGMARIMSNEGIRVTLIEEGGVSLPPYSHGFIGGAAGVYRDTVYFVGKIEEHPSYNIIKSAALSEGLRLVSLGDTGLLDVGGILFLE